MEDNGKNKEIITSIQKQIIEKTISLLSGSELFTQEMLDLLNSESLSEPWCNLEQLENVVSSTEHEGVSCA